MLKYCPNCEVLKNTEEFYACKSARDGKQRICISCSKINRKIQLQRLKKNVKLTPEQKRANKKSSDRKWRVNNPGKARARSRRYEKRVRRATPSWLTKTQKQAIDAMHINKSAGHHVDHIVPLKGKNVSGLHVPWNLQYLTAENNMKKKNKY